MNKAASDNKAASSYLTRVFGLTILALGGAELLTVLDGTVVVLALPQIESYFKTPHINGMWVITVYILSFSGFLFLGGRLGDAFGRKRVFLTGIAVLGLASLGSGLTTYFWQLLILRAVQAIGASFAAPTALAYVSTLYAPGATRSKAFASYGAMMGLGAILALTIGGALATYSWQWVFWINVPIALLIWIIAFKALPSDHTVSFKWRQLDYLGALLAFLSCLFFTLVIYFSSLSDSRQHFFWYSAIAAIAVIGGFCYRETKAQIPVMPLSIFRQKNKATALAVNTIAGGIMTSMSVTVAQYLQDVIYYTPMQTGLAVLPFAGGMGLSMIFSPIIAQKVSPRWIIFGSGSVLLIILVVICQFVHKYPGYFPLFFCAVGGVGIAVGMVLTSILLSVTAGVGIEDLGAMGALQKITLEIGSGIGVVIVTAVQNIYLHSRSAQNQATHWALEESFRYAVYSIIGLVIAAGGIVLFMTYTKQEVSQGIAEKTKLESGII